MPRAPVTEREMYPPVRNWLERLLKQRHRASRVAVFDSAQRSLARIIDQQDLGANLRPEWRSWEIFVDVVGFAVTAQTTHLALVECKLAPINIRDLSQILGYCYVALPAHAYILSPASVSG